MGKRAVKKYFSFMCLIITALVMILTFIGLYGGNANPVGNTAQAMLVYALPILIIANVVILIFWLIRLRWIWSLMPLITLLCCVRYIGAWYQVFGGGENSDNKQVVTVATYNVASFGKEASRYIAQDILTEMKQQQVDVLCMQEYSETSGDQKNSTLFSEYFKYKAFGNHDMVIFSKYPITLSKTLKFEYTNNSALWADVYINGKVLRVFNVHMETTGINRTLHVAAKAMNNGYDVSGSRLLSAIYGNYMMGMNIRAGQAITVSNEMRESDKPIIVAGDFNDVPYSYVYNTLLGNLKDGFRDCGKGFGSTFRGGKKQVRIDYIFYDKNIKGVDYFKSNLTYSDHVPVFCRMVLDQ